MVFGTWFVYLLGRKPLDATGFKVNLDGSVARLKTRFMVKGYVQTYDLDYSDTFSPVSKIIYVRLFISLAATYN